MPNSQDFGNQVGTNNISETPQQKSAAIYNDFQLNYFNTDASAGFDCC
jgi:hypothetical protein